MLKHFYLFFVLTLAIENSELEYKETEPILITESKISNTTDSINKLIQAITEVECSGDLKAYNPHEDAVGGLQIRPMLVKDVNRILKHKGSEKRYTLKDRWSYDKSKEMFEIYYKYYSKNKPMEVIAKRWNGGPNGERKTNTNIYWTKVKRELKKLKFNLNGFRKI